MKENIFSKTLKLEIFNFSDYLIDNPYIRYILKSWYSTIFGRKKLEKDHPVDVSDLTCWKSDAEDTVYRPIAQGDIESSSVDFHVVVPEEKIYCALTP